MKSQGRSVQQNRSLRLHANPHAKCGSGQGYGPAVRQHALKPTISGGNMRDISLFGTSISGITNRLSACCEL